MNSDSGRPQVLFLDANILISAAWREGCEMAQLWQMPEVELVTSGFVMGEVARNLIRPDQIERLRRLMRSVRMLELPERSESLDAGLPEKDRPVLDGAVHARANLLVTGDKKHFGHLYGQTLKGVRITAPSELLNLLRRSVE